MNEHEFEAWVKQELALFLTRAMDKSLSEKLNPMEVERILTYNFQILVDGGKHWRGLSHDEKVQIGKRLDQKYGLSDLASKDNNNHT